MSHLYKRDITRGALGVHFLSLHMGSRRSRSIRAAPSISLRGQRGALEADKELEVEVRADGEEDREPEHRVMVRRTRPHPAAAAGRSTPQRLAATLSRVHTAEGEDMREKCT